MATGIHERILVDMHDFTPIQSLIGGALFGLGAGKAEDSRPSPRGLAQNVARLAQSVAPSRRDSPLPGTEHVRGFGVPALCFSSGHVLALRVFAQTDFGPYRSLWHRDPRGAWSIYVDGAAIGEACPRYFGAALGSSRQARIRIEWRGPAELHVQMDDPPLDWKLTIGSSPILTAMNFVLPKISDKLWRRPDVPRMFERLSKHFLGDADMLAKTPNGHLHLLAPQRMFLIAASQAIMSGERFWRPDSRS
jgi:hypothetical protein